MFTKKIEYYKMTMHINEFSHFLNTTLYSITEITNMYLRQIKQNFNVLKQTIKY